MRLRPILSDLARGVCMFVGAVAATYAVDDDIEPRGIIARAAAGAAAGYVVGGYFERMYAADPTPPPTPESAATP